MDQAEKEPIEHESEKYYINSIRGGEYQLLEESDIYKIRLPRSDLYLRTLH